MVTTHARLIGAALAMMIAAPAAATQAAVQSCFDKPTGGEQKTCMAEVRRTAQGELEVVYRGILEAARAHETPTYSPASAIEKSQKAWEAYRNAECGDVIGGGSQGSGTSVMVMGCYAEKDYERIEELKVPFDHR
jgi:uncharacterized protein YecT (DUF1311 family)